MKSKCVDSLPCFRDDAETLDRLPAETGASPES